VGYTLEESGHQAFSAPEAIYAGSDTSKVIVGKMDGTYWYRVRATGRYGGGNWSDVVSVVVGISPGEGTIDVDVPWPGDGEEPQTGDVAEFVLPSGATMEMVWIEPGTFTMGTTEEQKQAMVSERLWDDSMEDELPAHEVTITQGFYLGKYELTQEQWETAMGTRPWSGKFGVVENPNHPAVHISWNDVQDFIVKLNEAAGSEVYRLPTEAEWEYACRAGTTTRWSFGDDSRQLKDYAWYEGNAMLAGEDYAHAVGTKLPNFWGLHDMHGNVWEWCLDWYDEEYYSVSPSVNPPGPALGNSFSNRVIRGGGFSFYDAWYPQSAERSIGHPGPYIGARLLRQEPQ
jgi:formylglycine-generating enzyme required for sulfatase activity